MNSITDAAADFDVMADKYCQFLAEDYAKWKPQTMGADRPSVVRHGCLVVDSYLNQTILFGPKAGTASRKYLPIVQTTHNHRDGEADTISTSAHSFIVLKDDTTYGFRRGDILKAATWKAPATNFSRGTIFDPATYADRVRWTGAL